ncbi:hypothetical protein Bca52824_023474 [Brassica carinata]|uniref:Uncharacterized protein n=1 Tax=Brassica carinata TaxID=52824 RepID=A0A8X8AUG3_BRACI|nr:hypothetical protein Bca52824_023474 [Brassica carinata]
MSKHSASSVPSTADKARSRRTMDSPISGSGSSLDPCEESDCDLLAPAPISYVYVAPPLVFDDRVLAGNMSGNMTEDPFTAYQEAAKEISAK